MTILLPPVAEVKPASMTRTLSDREFRAFLLQQAATLEVDADEYRPTAGPEFVPTSEEQDEAAELLNGEPDWDALADDALALDAVCSGHAWL